MFTERILKRVEPIWASYLEHPFVKGLGDGSLEKGKSLRNLRIMQLH